ncbi:uncharacterized protein LTR77_008754 [Saxophila tyrrhenica]|uniref:Uncharacterized protein n=1 Tax=Saxophila tyrrhenica TaxID=1690608 RepID=A0AAV9P0L8_9PEZI|nr:hypothetical protein LTR77_008754 [Saxophila tyrrhenica]
MATPLQAPPGPAASSTSTTNNAILNITRPQPQSQPPAPKVPASALQEKLLRFFDKPIELWGFDQIEAFNAFSIELKSAKTDLDPLELQSIKLIANYLLQWLGRMLFMDLLKDVHFEWFDANLFPPNAFLGMEPRDIGGACGVSTTGERWDMWLGILLHEATHAIFTQASIKPPSSPTDHFAAWHMVAKAVETRFLTELGLAVDLARGAALIHEYSTGYRTDLTDGELFHCFEGQFTYRPHPFDGSSGALFDHAPKGYMHTIIP